MRRDDVSDGRILEMFAAGLTMSEIGRAHRMQVCSVRERLLRYMSGAELALSWRATRLTKAPNPKDLAIVARYRNGETLQEIGTFYGVSRERIRQRIARVMPTKVVVAQRIPEFKLIEPIGTCVVCLGPAFATSGHKRNSKYPTCDHECHRINQLARLYFEPNGRARHRLEMAKTATRHPERHTAAHVRFAERVLSGAEIRTHFQFTEPKSTSKAYAAYHRGMEKRAERERDRQATA